jgi:GTP cyclohydrolase I
VAATRTAPEDCPSARRPGARLLRVMGGDTERRPDRSDFSDPCLDMVVVRDIEFCSLCEHHLIPSHGRAHVAYLPAGQVIGRSSLLRLVDVLARRLQVQERLTEEVARAVERAIKPSGVAVRLEATHLCRMLRGVEKRGSVALTSSFLGAFDRDMSLRREFYGALGGGYSRGDGESHRR